MATEMLGAKRSPREMEIIRSAYRNMAKRGSHRMSLREVAEGAGVSKALVLYHFGTKEALLFAAMNWAVERTAERIRQGLQESDAAADRITALIDAIFIDPEANRDFYLFYLDVIEHAGRVPSFGALSSMLVEIINGLYSEVIEDGVEKGDFQVDDVAVAARHMRALIEGTFLQWIQTPDWKQSHATWKERCREALLRLLASRTAL
ncbi:MAG TPA: TetR/AcrR family transcriptional regulator [Acidimicrobiia bacterium]|jgi:AcrR family transcriptional regulator|nr:TetR/AcrR family transcriptional regulator [Acidimicrobiia bacterium]